MIEPRRSGSPASINSPPSGRSIALFMLALIYMINFMDRTLLNTVGEAVKRDMGFSGLQIGLAGGLAVSLTNAIAALPIARLAERYSRCGRGLIWVQTMSIWLSSTTASVSSHCCGLKHWVSVGLENAGHSSREATISLPGEPMDLPNGDGQSRRGRARRSRSDRDGRRRFAQRSAMFLRRHRYDRLGSIARC